MHLSRRTFMMGSAAPLLAQRKAGRTRPNIVLILADDLGAWMLGCYGNQEIRTPNLDLLARSGTRFLSHSVCSPICSGSRATLFTGRLPRQHGIEGDSPTSLDKEVMISDVLSSAGYNCGYVGRWDMGEDAKPQHGFRFWYTMAAGSSSYQNPQMSWNGKMVQERGYLTDLMTQRAVQFLDEQKPGEPFFLVASYFNPRTPYDGHPQKYYDMYAKTPFVTTGWLPAAPNAAKGKEYLKDTVGSLRRCAAAVTALDDQIPALISLLDKKGLRDDTLVIFTADNGMLGGRHGLWDAGPGSDPINMYAEAVETPMLWNWAIRVPVEATRPELVSSYDLLQSLCEVAGAAPPAGRNLCGRSYAPLAMNTPLPRKAPWRNLVFGSLGNTEMARDLRFKIVLRGRGAGPNELYDLSADPREQVNQYANDKFVTVRNALEKELRVWREKYV